MRQTVEQCEDHLDIGKFRRGGFLCGPWCDLMGPRCCSLIARMKACRNRIVLEWRDRRPVQAIEIVWQQVGFGHRPWMVCRCGRKVGKLFLAEPDFYGPASYKCRHCLGLRYATQRMSRQQKKAFAASKLRLKKLRGDGRLTEPFPERPKGMRKRGYEMLRYKAEMREALIAKRVKRKLPDYRNLMPHL
jgi:hypothetical protein